MVIEASGSSRGISLASAISRSMGTIILKSTCSAMNDPDMPAWSNIANDVVVNEKRLQGSRCLFRNIYADFLFLMRDGVLINAASIIFMSSAFCHSAVFSIRFLDFSSPMIVLLWPQVWTFYTSSQSHAG